MDDYDRYLDRLIEESQESEEEYIGGIPAAWYEFNEDRSDGWDDVDW